MESGWSWSLPSKMAKAAEDAQEANREFLARLHE
jgi:hypothetical protein